VELGPFWVQPFGNDTLKIAIGPQWPDNLAFKIGDFDHWGGWSVQSKDNYWTTDVLGGDLSVVAKPITGLTLVLGFDGVTNTYYEKALFGVGYTIPDIGFVRVQYKHYYEPVTTAPEYTKGVVQAAFQLNPTDSGINVDLGVSYPFSKYQPVRFSVATDDTFGDINIKARFDGQYVNTTSGTTLEGFTYNGHAQVKYAVTDFGKLVASVGLSTDSENTTLDDLGYGFALGAEIPVSVATFSAGVAYSNLKGFLIPLRFVFGL